MPWAITEQIEYWKGTDDQDHYRTNRFLYAANGVDLIAHFGPGEVRQTGYAYDPAHPHLPVAQTNALNEVTHYYYDIHVGVFTNRFTYTPAGDLATLTDGKNQTTTWKHGAEGRVTEKWYPGQSTADLLYAYNAQGWLTNRFTRTGTGANTNGYVTTYTYDAVGNLTGVDYPAGTTDLAMAYDALNRLTNRVDAAGTARYSYAMPGSGRRTFSESGLWANDTVTVTNRYGRRAGLTIQQPAGSYVVTNARDAAGRWNVVGGTAGTFSYVYSAALASSLPVRLTLPGNG